MTDDAQGQAQPEGIDRRYEYRVVPLTPEDVQGHWQTADPPDLTGFVNEFTSDGWQVVETLGKGGVTTHLLLERPADVSDSIDGDGA